MKVLIIVALLILVFQIGIFIYLRKQNRKFRETDVLSKYGIRTRKDAWDKLADPDIPDEDREKIREIYEAGES
jgi:hypothetical protein